MLHASVQNYIKSLCIAMFLCVPNRQKNQKQKKEEKFPFIFSSPLDFLPFSPYFHQYEERFTCGLHTLYHIPSFIIATRPPPPSPPSPLYYHYFFNTLEASGIFCEMETGIPENRFLQLFLFFIPFLSSWSSPSSSTLFLHIAAPFTCIISQFTLVFRQKIWRSYSKKKSKDTTL